MGNKVVEHLMERMNSVIVGKEEQVRFLVTALLAKGHVLLEDVPGVGKTTLAKAVAETLDLTFGRISFTPDTLPSDVIGVSIYNRGSGEFVYQEGVIMNQIVLADEINRTSPKTQASLLEAMEERQVTVDGKVHKIKEPFMVIATQNPTQFLGTYNLPEAQLDRFLMRISLGYPKKEYEHKMASNFIEGRYEGSKPPVLSKDEVHNMQEEVEQVYIHDDLIDYIIELVTRTRNHQYITLGASPRGTLALIRAARATAYMEGRGYVIPDDIKKVIEPVLAHRLVLSVDAKMNHKTAEEIIKQIRISVEVPVLKSYC